MENVISAIPVTGLESVMDGFQVSLREEVIGTRGGHIEPYR